VTAYRQALVIFAMYRLLVCSIDYYVEVAGNTRAGPKGG